MLTTGVLNPVLIIDEIDKVAYTQHTSPLDDELLSACDGTHEVFDNFIGVRFDLGQCPIILTANEIGNVSRPLLDRCQVIRFPEADLDRLNKIMETYLDHKLPLYHGRVQVENTEVRALTKALFQRNVKSIRQYQKMLDKTLDEAYFKALEGENGTVTAEDYIWTVNEIVASVKRTVGF
jgi:ATP-dependent Lon protease